MAHIRKAAVIGAGTMGSGIASHLTNAGVPVVLLDLPSKPPASRNEHAERAIERQLMSAAFMHRDNCELITPGNVEDHLHLLADVDWIAEAVVERLEVKESLYRTVDEVRRPGSIVSSNTSTIPLATLTHNMPASFQQDFCITHFFNPVRHMRLLEMVAGPNTRPELIKALSEFCDVQLGKGVVHCQDTPGFLGNRVGVFAIQCAIQTAIEMGLTIEEADAAMGRPLGFPKTGVFALYDLIGLDLMLDVVKCLRATLPPHDTFNQLAAEIPIINQLVAEGSTGDKGNGGFFRAANGDKEAVDLRTGDYRPLKRPLFNALEVVEEAGLRGLLEDESPSGQFVYHVLAKTLAYAASLVPEVSQDLLSIDEAMKLGFNWTYGPFELIDQLGVDWFTSRLESDGAEVPQLLRVAAGRPMYRVQDACVQHLTIAGDYARVTRLPGVQRLADVATPQDPIVTNRAASLWDIGDDVACVEFHTKANALEPLSMQLIRQALSIVEERFQALIIHNDAPHFSMGVNLQFILDAAKQSAWHTLETMLAEFQATCHAMKYAPFPVIGAPGGMALGGGFEVLLHCDALYAHANTVTGLVETRVGLIPAGGGCKELLLRWSAPRDAGSEIESGAVRVFGLIGNAITAGSPLEGIPLRFFRAQDQWVMNRDRVLAGAKEMAIEMAKDYRPPTARTLISGGTVSRHELQAALDELEQRGQLTAHDEVVGRGLARVLAGGDSPTGQELTEQDLYDLEREVFRELVQTSATQERIEHMLKTGQPLRN